MWLVTKKEGGEMIGLIINVKKPLKQEVELELKWWIGKQDQMWMILK
jgi:hypothetical protein